jgi:hypothetical protein
MEKNRANGDSANNDDDGPFEGVADAFDSTLFTFEDGGDERQVEEADWRNKGVEGEQ